MKQNIQKNLAAAIASIVNQPSEAIFKLLEAPKNRDFGDLAYPCFLLAKEQKKSPVECAKVLATSITLPQGIKESSAVGPFVNFRFDTHYLATDFINNVINSKETLLKIPARPKTIIVEYSSPNIAKPFHVGHLRATLIGNCLDRVYRYLNYQTISINHLGDWGTQFGFVWAGCELWGKPKNDDIIALLEIYRRATDLKLAQETSSVSVEDQDLPDINEMARRYFVDLESGIEYAVTFWKYCLNISLEYLKTTYSRFGISFDHYTGESFYSDKLDIVRQEIDAAGILRESQGAYGIDLGEELGFARIYTPDGRSLYLTRDIAAAIYRAKTFSFDRCIYVVGAPQTLHFKQLKGILAKLGHDYANRIEHVAFGHVLGIKTRGKGDFIELNDFLDEAEERALEIYHQQVTKRPAESNDQEVAKAVALAAIVFSNLNRTNHIDVQFSWDTALTFQGDTGPYLLYAYARISSIKERFLAEGGTFIPIFNPQLLTEAGAHELLSVLADFENTIEATADDNEPMHLTTFALNLAKAFSRCYNELKVVGAEPELANTRLCLFEASRRILGETLKLLGITPIERM